MVFVSTTIGDNVGASVTVGARVGDSVITGAAVAAVHFDPQDWV
jgi:hypothetical protein